MGSLSLMYGDLMIHSKDFWDAEGKAGYTTKLVGTGALKLVERKLGQSLHYARVENHWRHTPEYKELEFRGRKRRSPDLPPCWPVRSTWPVWTVAFSSKP